MSRNANTKLYCLELKSSNVSQLVRKHRDAFFAIFTLIQTNQTSGSFNKRIDLNASLQLGIDIIRDMQIMPWSKLAFELVIEAFHGIKLHDPNALSVLSPRGGFSL